jgi:hypothetical protein
MNVGAHLHGFVFLEAGLLQLAFGALVQSVESLPKQEHLWRPLYLIIVHALLP